MVEIEAYAEDVAHVETEVGVVVVAGRAESVAVGIEVLKSCG